MEGTLPTPGHPEPCFWSTERAGGAPRAPGWACCLPGVAEGAEGGQHTTYHSHKQAVGLFQSPRDVTCSMGGPELCPPVSALLRVTGWGTGSGGLPRGPEPAGLPLTLPISFHPGRVPAAAQSCDLEEVMMDALVSNKPEFVRLFVDHGANVADFLTYGRLQQLYRAVPPKSPLFELLQRKHEEGRLALQARGPPAGPPAFSLHEVSRVLKDFLHDACRGLYQVVSQVRGTGGGLARG